MNEIKSSLITKHDVAAKLRISLSTINVWTRNGKIKSVIINKRGDRRYKQSDIDKFLKQGEGK